MIKNFKNLNTRKISITVALVIVVLILPLFVSNPYLMQIINMIGIYALVGTGLNILTGYTGQISLGQAAFYGLGAYTTAILNTRYGFNIFITLPMSILICTLFALILAIPALKVRGSYLALVTIGFGEVIRMLLVNWIDLTKGPAGIVGIKPANIFGYQFSSLYQIYYLILLFVVLGILYQVLLINSRTGRALKAIRDDDKVAQLTGIDITVYKTQAFIIGAIYAAIAGTLYAFMIRYVSPDSFTANESNLFLWTAIMGGIGTTIGPIVGAVIMVTLPELLRFLGQWRMIVYGVVLLITIIKLPGGLTPFITRKYNELKEKIALKKQSKEKGDM